MRAEDLFEAMGALDEQLIALSEEDARRAREAGRQSAREKENRKIAKRRKRAEIYRFAAVAMTTAAAVFIVLTARDFLGARNSGLSENAAVSSEYSREESAAEEAAQDTLAAGALGIEADEAAEPDAGTASKFRAAQDADAAAEEAAPEAKEAAAPDAEEAAASDVEEAAASDAEEAAKGAGEAAENEAVPQDTEKSAVDMLGDLKGDYVKLEIITAEDKANGGERKVPEYSEEKERALTAALEDGQKMPTMFVRIGNPVGYVFLTDSTGKEDTVTFYENGFVGIDTIPSFVMKLSDQAFEDVMEMFR